MIAFKAFEDDGPAFTPTPTTPDPQTIRDALRAPDANDWTAAMDTEIIDSLVTFATTCYTESRCYSFLTV